MGEVLKIHDEEGYSLHVMKNISKPLFGFCGLQMGLMGLQMDQDHADAPSMRARR